MSQLNIDTFNEILFKALKDDSPKGKLELLKAELEMAFMMHIDCMSKVIDDLNHGRKYQSDLEKVNATNHSCECLVKQIEEIEKNHPELKNERSYQQTGSHCGILD